MKAWGWRLGDFKDDFDPTDYLLNGKKVDPLPTVAYLRQEATKPLSPAKAKAFREQLAAQRHTWKTIGWLQEMEDYCVQDVVVTLALWDDLESYNCPLKAYDLEHDFAWIIKRQEQFGFKFNEVKADKLHGVLEVRKAALNDQLQAIFPPWDKVIDPHFIPKVNNKSRGYVKGVPTVKTKRITFNAGSRDHIAERLNAVYGWKPTVFNQGDGKPTVDEPVLKSLKYEAIPMLLEYLMVDKRLGMLAEGKQAWKKQVRDGRIYGRVDTMGAVTGRCTHSKPNVAQVPATKSAYGAECRDLFTVDDGYVLVGADASGLELRCLAHFLANYDNGAYAEIVLNGDIHTANQEAAGLPTRDNAKTFIYGWLYGAGDAKIGEIVGRGAQAGKKLKNKFLSSIPAIGSLSQAVKAKAKRYKKLKGLDGRTLHVRHEHASLNTLLQSAGALIMKRALVELEALLQAHGLQNSWQSDSPDYEFVVNCHDEWGAQVKPEHAEKFARLSVEAMTLAGDFFNFRCRIDGEAKIGASWKETH